MYIVLVWHDSLNDYRPYVNDEGKRATFESWVEASEFAFDLMREGVTTRIEYVTVKARKRAR